MVSEDLINSEKKRGSLQNWSPIKIVLKRKLTVFERFHYHHRRYLPNPVKPFHNNDPSY